MGIFDDILGDLPDFEDEDNVGQMLEEVPAPGNSRSRALQALANKWEMAPLDLARTISYETRGTFSPAIRGGKNMNHIGTIQFGIPEQRAYGANQRQSFEEQLAIGGPVDRYFTARKLPLGADLTTIYRTINGGNPNASLSAHDGNGTIAQHIQRIRNEHTDRAQNFLAGLIAQQQARNEGPNAELERPYRGRGPDVMPIRTQGPQQVLEERDPTQEELDELERPYIAAPPNMVPLAQTDPELAEQQNTPGAGRQFAATALGAIAASPLDMLQILSPSYTNQQNAEMVKQIAKDFINPGEVKTGEDQLLASLGKGVSPAGKLTLPISAATGVANVISDAIVGPADATPNGGNKVTKKSIAELKKTIKQQEIDNAFMNATTFINEGLRVNPNLAMFPKGDRFAMQKVRDKLVYSKDGAYDGFDVLRNPADNKFYVVPAVKGRNQIDTMRAVQETMGENDTVGFANFTGYNSEAEAKRTVTQLDNTMKPEIARRQTMVQTDGGPIAVDMTKLLEYGGIAAVSTLGMMYGPKAYKFARNGAIPPLGLSWDNRPELKVRSALDTHPDVGLVSKAGDLFRTTVDDVNKGAVNILERVGVPETIVKNIRQKFDIESGNAAQLLADSAWEKGNMRSLNYTFKVDIPLKEINRRDNPTVSQYLNAKNSLEQLEAWQRKNILNPRSTPAPDEIRGLDEIGMRQMIRDLEAANPELKNISRAYRDNHKAVIKFLSEGDGAIYTPLQARQMLRERKHYIPGTEKQLGGVNVSQESATFQYGEWMRAQMRRKFNNEAKLIYIDEALRHNLKGNKKLFVKLEGDELKHYPNREASTVEVFRNGKKEVYSTDPFLASTLKKDPYYTYGVEKWVLEAPKRVFEMTTTGALAPWFAYTNLMRSHRIVNHSIPEGRKGPWFYETAMAVPEALSARLAERIGTALDNGNGGWLRTMFGDDRADGFSKAALGYYQKSMTAWLDSGGTHHGSILEKFGEPTAIINKNLANAPAAYRDASLGTGRLLWQGYNDWLQAMHNAPAYAYAKKNRAVSHNAAEAAYEARNLTGNPRASGQLYAGADSRSPIAFDAGDGVWDNIKAKGALGAGIAAQTLRSSSPWSNTILQGQKRFIQSYLDDPVKFTKRMWYYSQMPAASSYMIMQAAGRDPNGRSYVDYGMHGRSDYDFMMNLYIPIPGVAAERGIRIPMIHEMSLFSAMMLHGMHHILRNNQQSNMSDDALRAVANFGGTMMPPMPTAIGVGFGLSGQSPPQSIGSFAGLGGDAFTPRRQAFDQWGSGIPTAMEMTAKALAPGFTDIIMASWMPFVNTPDSPIHAIGNAVKGGAYRMAQKAPGINWLPGITTPMAGNVPIVREFFDNKRVIDDLTRHYGRYDKDTKNKVGGEIDLTGASKAGRAVQEQFYPAPAIKNFAGVGQPDATNPLYYEFGELLDKMFRSDAPNDKNPHGVGFKTALKDMKYQTDQLRDLRNVHFGNYGLYLKMKEKQPTFLAEMEKYGVDYTDVDAVRTHFTNKFHWLAKHLVFMINSAENKMTTELPGIIRNYALQGDMETAQELGKYVGRPIKMKDLHPYKSMGADDDVPDMALYGGSSE